MPIVSHERLERIYVEFALAHGATAPEASVFSRSIARADLRGYTRQGVAIVPYYHQLLTNRVMRFGHAPEVEREGPGFAVLDGRRNVGQITGTAAMEIAMEKAGGTGVGMVTVTNAGDFAMASGYALQALDRDQIGMAMSNGYPIVAPWGGRERLFGTNPMAIAVPTNDELPLVIDMATGRFSMGTVVRAARDGERLAESVVDAHGRYGDDPAAIVVDSLEREPALRGALLPAGPKGYAWMLMIEVLAGVLSGSGGSFLSRGGDGPVPEDRYGNCFLAIDVAQFLDLGRFKRDMDRLLATIAGSTPAEGFQAVRLPGQRSGREYHRRLVEGVPVRDEEWAMLMAVASDLGLILEHDTGERS